MRKLFFGLFLMVAAFSTVGNALAAPGSYTAEVKIDITADSAAAARDKGMKEAYRSADVESKQCEEIKLHFFEMHTVAVGYILRKSKRGLLCIVCGEYG